MHKLQVIFRSILIPKEGILEKPVQYTNPKSSRVVTLLCSERSDFFFNFWDLKKTFLVNFKFLVLFKIRVLRNVLLWGLLHDLLAITALFQSIFGEDGYFHLWSSRFYFVLCLFFQWQCKADLENTYRFGRIEVSCEGYDYPDDPYILRGSCSLMFRLELTEEGERKVKNSGSFGSGYYQSRKDSSDAGAGAVVVIVLLVLAFGVYKLFLSNQQPQQSFGDSDGFTRPFWQSQQAPPPPGFKASFTGTDGSETFIVLKRASRIILFYLQ